MKIKELSPMIREKLLRRERQEVTLKRTFSRRHRPTRKKFQLDLLTKVKEKL